ncbi:hypothetical protein SKAU_G00323840 [Synaphobranchus kaupii]|uniref:Dapper homolog 3 n=1 Tax=Synaphobranchus kaupii TaxID=118154 RepID=A0A9Q1EPC9_SYNKA|nr:hypothetical protein SKAU_G00323840 [Synaphobranchus kaupii]
MYRALSFPVTAERSRNRERLEASLAGLRELELLKQRQEFLVLRALSLADSTPGHASWGDLQPPRSAPPALTRAQDDLTLRRQLNSLQCASWGLMAELEQQVGELRVEAEPVCAEPPGDVGDSRPSSGFYELSEVQSSAGLSDSSIFGELSPGHVRAIRVAYPSERPKSVGDVFVANREGLLESGPHSLVPRSFSAPYPSLEGIAEGAGEDEPWVWDPSAPSGLEDEPTAEDYKQARRVHTYILGLIQRRALPQRPCKPRTSLGPESRGVARQSSLCRKEPAFAPEHHNVSPGLEGPVWACRSLDEEDPYGGMEEALPLLYARQRPACLAGIRSASLDFPCGAHDPIAGEAESPRFHGYPRPRSPPPEDRLVNAQYIPAQPCRAPVRAPAHRATPPPKPARTSCSPERAPQRARPAPKKCRLSEERAPAPRKPSRKACRSQSENSLVGQRGGVPERKYSTLEREGGRPGQARTRRPPPANTACRRWRSTLELSQDEGELPCDQAPRRGARKPRFPPPYIYGHAHGPVLPAHPHHLAEYLERAPLCRPEEGYAPPPAGESESSTSEADSPGSTSLSSDSEESGGLVWPQQLPPPAVSPPAPPGAAPPKAFVKIKASHALKKKILRFRTGSLKVMTTV